MNIKSRLKKISDAMKTPSAEDGNQPFLNLEQWKRHRQGEDITAEIPPHRRAEYDEWERIADRRVKEAERIYLSHQPELQETL